MSWNNTFTATQVEPPSFPPDEPDLLNSERLRHHGSGLASLSEMLSSVVSTTRFTLGLPEDNTYRPSRFKKSEKLGDVDEANPEHNDYFVPTPIPSAARKEVYGGVAKSCGVGITFVYDEAQEAVVVQRILKDSPAHRSDQIEVGDILVEVDGLEVDGQPLDVVHSIVKGFEASPCSLTFWRDGREISVNVLREHVDHLTEYTAPVRCGVGITFETMALDGSARVKSVVRGGGADNTGLIKQGDVLFEVGRTNVFREPLDLVADLLLGDEGSSVRLLFLRGTRIFIEVNVTRKANMRQSDMHSILLHAQGFNKVSSLRQLARQKAPRDTIEEDGGEEIVEPGVSTGSYREMTRAALSRNQKSLPRSMTMLRP